MLSEKLVWFVSDSLANLPEVWLITSLSSLSVPVSWATKLFLSGTCSGRAARDSPEPISEQLLVVVVGLTNGLMAVLRDPDENRSVNLNRLKDTCCFGCLHRKISANRFLKPVCYLSFLPLLVFITLNIWLISHWSIFCRQHLSNKWF